MTTPAAVTPAPTPPVVSEAKKPGNGKKIRKKKKGNQNKPNTKKSSFVGLADGPMTGKFITIDRGRLAGQYREFKMAPMSHCGVKGIETLGYCIETLTFKTEADYEVVMANPLHYAHRIEVIEDGVTGGSMSLTIRCSRINSRRSMLWE